MDTKEIKKINIFQQQLANRLLFQDLSYDDLYDIADYGYLCIAPDGQCIIERDTLPDSDTPQSCGECWKRYIDNLIKNDD